MEPHGLLLLPLLFWLSVSSEDITGPKEVKGLEQGSLEVQCHYAREWETYVKWWCRGAVWSTCKFLVKTTGSEQEVKRNRVSIRDDQRRRTFTVTMKELMRNDSDIYWCGIERTGTDPGFLVNVTIGPATTTMPTTITTIISTTNMFTAPGTVGKTTGSPTVTSQNADGSSVFTNLNILLPILAFLLLLLLLAASLLAWRMVKRKKKAAGIFPGQVLEPLDDDLCYANLALPQTGTPRNPSRRKAPTKPSSAAEEDQVEVEYSTMAPLPGENIDYAVLSLDALDQDSTYVNTSDLIATLPRDHEEGTEYSTIRKLSLH